MLSDAGKRRRPWLAPCVAVLAAVIAGSAPTAASAQQVTRCDQESHSYSKVSRPARYGFQPQKVVDLASGRDGATIQVGVVRPKVPPGERVPVIVDAGPYYHPMQDLDLRGCAPRLTENFVPQGYAVALVAVRGTSDSGGCMDLFGPAERADLNQAITWLARQPWSTGAVGMTGLSYDGSTPWEVASFGNPHLKTIVPVEGVPDIFQLLFGGGTPDWRGPAVLNDIYYVQSILLYLAGRDPQHTLEVTACPDYAVANAASVHSAQSGEPDPFGYWAARRFRDRVERNYRGSVLLVQGLQDWNVNPGLQYPWIGNLERRGLYVKHLIGQWGHTNPDTADPPDQRPDYADLLLDWFDRWLKGRSVDLGPRVQVEDSDGRWRNATEWPPEEPATTLWLTADQGLGGEPDPATGSELLAPDPAHTQAGGLGVEVPDSLGTLCGPPNCAYFATEPLPDGYRFAGLPGLRLTVTPSGPAGQLSAYLYEVTAAGATRLGWGQVDLRFPRGDGDARRVEPGKPTTVDFDLQPLDAVVAPNARLALVLSEGTAYNRLASVPNFPMRLEVGGTSGSLTLSRVRPSAADFFTP